MNWDIKPIINNEYIDILKNQVDYEEFKNQHMNVSSDIQIKYEHFIYSIIEEYLHRESQPIDRAKIKLRFIENNYNHDIRALLFDDIYIGTIERRNTTEYSNNTVKSEMKFIFNPNHKFYSPKEPGSTNSSTASSERIQEHPDH